LENLGDEKIVGYRGFGKYLDEILKDPPKKKIAKQQENLDNTKKGGTKFFSVQLQVGLWLNASGAWRHRG